MGPKGVRFCSPIVMQEMQKQQLDDFELNSMLRKKFRVSRTPPVIHIVPALMTGRERETETESQRGASPQGQSLPLHSLGGGTLR